MVANLKNKNKKQKNIQQVLKIIILVGNIHEALTMCQAQHQVFYRHELT